MQIKRSAIPKETKSDMNECLAVTDVSGAFIFQIQRAEKKRLLCADKYEKIKLI
jgi:hypothetical protein